MMSLDQVSKTLQVSTHKLQFYRRIGLVQPAEVDVHTGHPLYSDEQLKTIEQVVVLEELGQSPSQIRQLLDRGVTAAELRSTLLRREAEIQKRFAARDAALERATVRINQVNTDNSALAEQVRVRAVAPQMVIASRRMVPNLADMAGLFSELYARLGDLHLPPSSGAPILIYHDEDYREQDADVEAAIPIGSRPPGVGQVVITELAGEDSMACITHHGSYAAIGVVYGALMTWLELQNCRMAGPTREVFVTGVPPSRRGQELCIVEVQVPFEPKGESVG